MWNHIKIISAFKSLLPLEIKLVLIRIYVFIEKIYYMWSKEEKLPINENKRIIYLLLSTDYSNLGDHAMTYTQKINLENRYPNAQVIEITVANTLKYLKTILKALKKEDIITLKGGGNIGLEYFREELYRREIIKTFKNNRIVIFPQTIYFPKSKLGVKELEITCNIFKENQNLYLFTRDKVSYDTLSDYLDKRIFLVPDTVLLLDDIKSDIIRNGAMTAMRQDVEGTYSLLQKEELIELLKKYYSSVKISDTTTNYPISVDDRKAELQKNWNLFLSSEVVLTDRLHGMIFAAITKTPCIVFKTYNHKLQGQYEWLKHLNYIKFIEFDLKEIEKLIIEFKNNKIIFNERIRYNELFDEIFRLID